MSNDKDRPTSAGSKAKGRIEPTVKVNRDGQSGAASRENAARDAQPNAQYSHTAQPHQDQGSKWTTQSAEFDVGAGGDTANDTTGSLDNSFTQELEALRAEKASLTEQFVRTLAEMDNLRKRTEREKADTRKYAIAEFAKDLLGVGDSLKRAVQSLPEDTRDAEATLKSFAEGIEMTDRTLISVLERHGVKRNDDKGQPFDPNRHEAVAKIPNPEVPDRTVVEVLQDGYMIGDRVLRPSMVVVSEGGPKVSQANTTVQDNGASDAAKPQAANDDLQHDQTETESSNPTFGKP